MSAYLVTSLRESCGYLRDQDWHETARLMTLAADEIEHLAARVRELEGNAAREGLHTPPASNQNVVPAATVRSSRR